MVYCSKEKLDVQMAVFQRAKDNVGYTAYVSLLLILINCSFGFKSGDYGIVC